jgi:hypothetical protein
MHQRRNGRLTAILLLPDSAVFHLDTFKENIMNATFIALALVISATTASAYAAVPDSHVTQSARPKQVQPLQPDSLSAPGKTRAEVRHELDLARKDGELAAINKFYQGS